MQKRLKSFYQKWIPIRVSTHFNIAFALHFALEYTQEPHDKELESCIIDVATLWFLQDKNMQVLEPCGDEFLSPTLMEAVLLSQIIDTNAFIEFFHAFLPTLQDKEPKALFTIARVADRSDGKIAHLDGLNLSRAWNLALLSGIFKNPNKELSNILLTNALHHFQNTIDHIYSDYMGSHWLGSFAMLAIDAIRGT